MTNQHPMLAMIHKMTESKKCDRLDVNDLIDSIAQAKKKKNSIIGAKLFGDIERIIDEDTKAMNSDEQMKKMFDDLDPDKTSSKRIGLLR